jgi:NADPH:quinone reductase-like Zn-dependent oxidoreductase
MDLVKSLGADQVIDYSAEDFSQNAKTYDVIIDTVGKVSFRNCKASLAPGGVFVPIEFKMREIIQLLITKIIGGKKVVVGISQDRMEDLRYLADLLSRAEIRPVIDTVYPLGDIVPAHRRVESRHKTGSVVIAMPDHEIASSRISAAELI